MTEVGADDAAILPFPFQNSLTRDIRAAAAKRNRPEFLSMWAGQGAAMTRALPAAALVETLAAELERALGERGRR